MSKEKLIFCPLGGSGEIGGNMNLYAYGEEDNQKWIIVDMGVSFADDSVHYFGQVLNEKHKKNHYTFYSSKNEMEKLLKGKSKNFLHHLLHLRPIT